MPYVLWVESKTASDVWRKANSLKPERNHTMNNSHQQLTIRRLETVLIAFFVLAALSVLIVYFADPTIFTNVLMLESTTADKYPLPATLFLLALLIFITILIIGVTKHWRWLFWLLLIANSFSILEVPATILQFTGVIPDPYPVWYSLYRMGIALIQVGIAIWMIRIIYLYGEWGGKSKKLYRRKPESNLPIWKPRRNKEKLRKIE
jgi:hypothetical protein